MVSFFGESCNLFVVKPAEIKQFKTNGENIQKNTLQEHRIHLFMGSLLARSPESSASTDNPFSMHTRQLVEEKINACKYALCVCVRARV